QLATLPRRRGARCSWRADALRLPEGARDSLAVCEAGGRERIRRGGGRHPRAAGPGLPRAVRRGGVRLPRDARRRPRARRASCREPAAGDRGGDETPPYGAAVRVEIAGEMPE